MRLYKEDAERAVLSLSPAMQERMARLVLGGWVLKQIGSLAWRAHQPRIHTRMYTASTLLTLLNQMGNEVIVTEAGLMHLPGLLDPDARRGNGDLPPR